MYYQSTRDKNTQTSAAGAIVLGLARDGGLFVPQIIPRLTRYEIENMAKMSYQGRAVDILRRFLTDFDNDEIKACVDSAYNKTKFETDSVAPVYKLYENLYILELWHGPTCAFKDMALQILPHLLTVSAKKEGVSEDIAILVATSGDTGKAALEGFRDVDKTKIIVFYPRDGVSNIQKLQMVTQEGENVGVCAVDGNFDDAQNGVKSIFSDKEFEKLLKNKNIVLSSANSINWGRLVPQIVYYFSAYADLIKNEQIEMGAQINVVVPTGNFGNILAAYYAKCMGLPVKKLICASNLNNVLTDFIKSGTYDRNRSFKTTVSPSMDILISSNLERFLYDITGGDTEKIRTWMGELSKNGSYTVDDETRDAMSKLLWAGFCDDDGTIAQIKKTEEEYSYVLDTHTAVGMNVYAQYVKETGDETKTVIASTASPYKFSESVAAAVFGEENIQSMDDLEIIEKLSERSGIKIPASLSELGEKKVRFEEVCTPSSMKTMVEKILGINNG
ncbi:MAG: threonine synthase [Firmicutes bacterium]|nr:threonine synthase [Bacillota bacterium]